MLPNLILNSSAPALDPLIIDWETKGLTEDLPGQVYDCLTIIKGRLFNAGFTDYQQAILSTPKIIDFLQNYLYPKILKVRFLKNTSIPNEIFILTKSGNGIPFIHPPYNSNYGIMSWDEYFLRVGKGEKLNLMIPVPWAQAKIINISY
jgi:hypothetical protein